MKNRVNEKIYARIVRVTKDGTNLGIFAIREALAKARQEGLDLVEIVPNAKPPVCSIMDYGKYQFDRKKREKEIRSKQKSSSKEIRLRPYSSDHDVGIKIQQVKKFLEENRTVSISMRFKNRELAHKDQGWKIVNRIISDIQEIGKVEQKPRFEGTSLNMRLSPK